MTHILKQAPMLRFIKMANQARILKMWCMWRLQVQLQETNEQFKAKHDELDSKQIAHVKEFMAEKHQYYIARSKAVVTYHYFQSPLQISGVTL